MVKVMAMLMVMVMGPTLGGKFACQEFWLAIQEIGQKAGKQNSQLRTKANLKGAKSALRGEGQMPGGGEVC